MGKIIAKYRRRHAQRGDYACLVDTAGSTDRHDTGVALQLLDLPMHKQHWKGTINHHSCSTYAMRKHMMAWHFKCTLKALNMTNRLNGVPLIFIALLGINPIFKLNDSEIPLGVHYCNCGQLCMMMMILEHSCFSEHFGISNTIFWCPGNKLLYF